VLVAFACARPPGGDIRAACASVTYTLDAGTSAADFSGRFAVTMVATTGDSSGNTAAGRLELVERARPDAPLVGTMDVPVETVDALRLGSLTTSADSAPGVLLLRSGEERPTILLRLGSEANAAGVIRFDGGYTVLEVLRVDEQGFAGSWRSGAGSGPERGGHFCAIRIGETPS